MTEQEHEFYMRQILSYTGKEAQERKLKSEMVRAGKICRDCRSSLPPPHTPGLRRCERCCRLSGTRHVYLSFMLRDGWNCQFWESNLKTELPKRLTFRDPCKIREAAERGHGFNGSESRQASTMRSKSARAGSGCS
jgi:hypothetical protein